MFRLEVDIPKGWTLVYGKAPMRALLRKAGQEVAARARALIRAKGPGGRQRVSTPGQPPVSRTGELARSIKVSLSRSGEAVMIRDIVYYALFLEAGARGGGGASRIKANILPAGQRRGRNRMKRSAVSKTRVLQPRPFLSRALTEVAEASLGDRIVDAVVSGVAFKRAKL